MTIKIRIITPHTTDRPTKLDEVKALLDFYKDVEFSQVELPYGPKCIEGMYHDAFAAPGIVAACVQAQQDGVHAVMIDCMGDPALDAAREAVSIPVFGPGETCLHVGALLGHRISVVTITESVRPIFERHARVYGVQSKLASVRVTGISVLEISHEPEKLLNQLTEQSLAAINDDKADVIILGCTGFLGVSAQLAENLRHKGYAVPVLNPIQVTVSVAAALANLGLTHSPRCYHPAKDVALDGFDDFFDVNKWPKVRAIASVKKESV